MVVCRYLGPHCCETLELASPGKSIGHTDHSPGADHEESNKYIPPSEWATRLQYMEGGHHTPRILNPPVRRRSVNAKTLKSRVTDGIDLF